MSIIETMARAIRRWQHLDAETCAQAALDALKAEGFAIVPVEPSEAIKEAGAEMLFGSSKDDWGEEAADIFRAMVAAAALRAREASNG